MEDPLLSLNTPGFYTATEAGTSNEDEYIFDTKTHEDSSLTGGVMILVNTAIGSGTLLVPYCFKAGLINALGISTLFAVLTIFSYWNFIDSGHAVKKYDFKGLFSHVFSEKYLWIVYFCIFMTQWGSCCIYCHWNGRLLNTVFNIDHPVFGTNDFWDYASTIAFIVPLVLLKSLSMLEGLSFLCIGLVVVLIIHSLYYFVKGLIADGFDPNHEIAFFRENDILITAFSVNSMAYNCIVNLFPTLEHIKNPTLKRAHKLASSSVTTAFFMYNLFGIFAYLHLFDALQNGSALEYYDLHNIFTKVTIVGVVVVLIVSGPLVIWGARNSFMSLVWKEKPSYFAFATTGVVMVLLAAFISTLSQNVLLYFDVVGGLFTPILIFTLPAIFYLRCVQNRPIFRTILSYIILIFSLGAIVSCTYQAVSNIIADAKK